MLVTIRVLSGYLLASVLMAAGYVGPASGQTAASYAGTYSGTYSGDDQGTWSATVQSSGAITLTGKSTPTGETFTGNSTVPAGGAISVPVGSTTSSGSTFSGTINAATGNISGSWSNPGAGAGGSFSGTRIGGTTTTTGSTTTTTLSGSAPAVPVVALSQSSLTFSSQKVGAISAAQTISLSNTGGASLNIGSIAASGDYATTTTCGASLAAGANCSISLVFIATYPGARSGNLSISTNAAGSPHLLPLNGTASYTVLSYPLQLEQGWNLLGNSINKVLNVARVFGNADAVTTVWKWDVKNSGWQFYTPSLASAALQAYAAGKGYGVLSEINPGEGYWVNAKLKTTLASPSAAAFERTADFLMSGWNLVATGSDVSPSAFNASLSAISPAVSLTSLWAWDSLLSKWYFYAPSLDAQGGGALASYIAGKGYLDFATASKTLGKGTGFWVNSTNSNTSPPVTVSGIVAMGWPFGTDNLVKRDAQGHDSVDNGDRVIYCNSNNQRTGAYISCTEANSDGKYSLQQSAAEIGDYIWGKVEGSWLGKKVKQVALGMKTGLEKITNNVNPLTSLQTKAYVSHFFPNKTIDDQLPPAGLPGDPDVLDRAWQGLKKVLGPLASNLGIDSSSDPSFVADPAKDPRDLAMEQISAKDDGAGSAVIADKNGKTMATVPLVKVANNTASGDAETVVQTEADAAKAAADRMSEIQLQLSAYQNFFATARPAASDPALAALFDASFLQNGQDKPGFVASLPTRTEPATGAEIRGEMSEAPLGKVANDATRQWITLWITQSGGGTGEVWLAIKDGGTGKWLLAGNQLGAPPASNTLTFSAPIYDNVFSEYYAGTAFSYVGQPGQPIAPPAFTAVSPAPAPLTTRFSDVSWYAFRKPWPRCRYSLNTLNQDELLACELENYATVYCWIKPPADPGATTVKSCASLSIGFNRNAGSLSFASTQLHEILTPSNTNSVSGSLSFTPF